MHSGLWVVDYGLGVQGGMRGTPPPCPPPPSPALRHAQLRDQELWIMPRDEEFCDQKLGTMDYGLCSVIVDYGLWIRGRGWDARNAATLPASAFTCAWFMVDGLFLTCHGLWLTSSFYV